MLGILLALAAAAIGLYLGCLLRHSLKKGFYSKEQRERDKAKMEQDIAEREAREKWLAENPPITAEQVDMLIHAVDLYYTDWVTYVCSHSYGTCGFCINFGSRNLELSEIDVYYDQSGRGSFLSEPLKNVGWQIGSGYKVYDIGTANYDRTDLLNRVCSDLKQNHSDFITQNILKSDGYSLVVTQDDYKNYFHNLRYSAD